jgi:hypothetical protein
MTAIDTARLADLLAPGDEEGASNAAKGGALEAALRYAFEQIPGVSCEMQRAKNASASEEIDLLFSNVRNEDGLRRFESELLVEAKNWAKPVGAIEINWFATKLRRRNQRTGVLVAARGITGNVDLMNAAVGQIGQALAEGREVVVLLREELEAVSSGERLAKLLEQKRDHLVARQDILVADPAELRKQGGSMIRFGSEAFGALMRGERVKLVEEAQGLQLHADDEGEVFGHLRTALQRVDQANDEWNAAPDRDPRGLELRARLIESAGWCATWLDRLEFDDASTIWINGSLSGLDRVGPRVGSRLWPTLADYYLSELGRAKPEAPRETLLFALLAMLIEQILSLDDYWPEEFD